MLSGLAAENELRVVADGAYMRSGEGLHRFVDPVDDSVYLYTQFETFDAHRMYACFDQPDLKADVPPAGAGAARLGGRQQRRRAGPPRRGRGGHLGRSPRRPACRPTSPRWSPGRTPRSTTSTTGSRSAIYCRRSLQQHLDPDDLFTVTKQGFDYYHRVFGYRYPFGKYDQLFVPEFNAGAMENAGAVTFLEDYVFRSKVTDAAYERRAETVLHEMAHMWFGDLVTMRWWDDLWLNESFATYMSVLCQVEATRYTRGWTTFASSEKTWAYRQDQLPSTHPIAADIADIEAVKVNFDGITYAKGASVLKQLVAWVGQDAFLSALQSYFTAHEYGNTVLADLLGALERASGRDLSDWSREWLETAGVNTLRPVFETDGDGTITSFTVVQEAAEAWPTLRSHRVAIGFYDLVDGRAAPHLARGARRRRRQDRGPGPGRHASARPGARQRRRPDLRQDPARRAVAGDAGRARRRLRAVAAAHPVLDGGLGHDARRGDAGPRLRGHGAGRDRRRERHRRRAGAAAPGAGGPHAVRRTRVGAHRTRAARRGRRAGRARGRARQRLPAGVGAGARLGGRSSDEQLALLRGLLDGSTEVPGLVVDTDLRWHLLMRLVALGVVGDEAIDAELERDRTSAGERHGRDRARPASDAGGQGRGVAPGRRGRVGAERRALGGRRRLRPPRAASPAGRTGSSRYFEVVGRVWETRTAEFAQNVAIGLYPSLLVSPEIVERTDAYLASQEMQPALARLLLEGRDGVARALRARAGRRSRLSRPTRACQSAPTSGGPRARCGLTADRAALSAHADVRRRVGSAVRADKAARRLAAGPGRRSSAAPTSAGAQGRGAG